MTRTCRPSWAILGTHSNIIWNCKKSKVITVNIILSFVCFSRSYLAILVTLHQQVYSIKPMKTPRRRLPSRSIPPVSTSPSNFPHLGTPPRRPTSPRSPWYPSGCRTWSGASRGRCKVNWESSACFTMCCSRYRSRNSTQQVRQELSVITKTTFTSHSVLTCKLNCRLMHRTFDRMRALSTVFLSLLGVYATRPAQS